MKYITFILGVVAIIVVSFYHFGVFDKIINQHNNIVIEENEYYLGYNFDYVNIYSDEIHSYKELVNYIYYVVNSGTLSADGYCNNDYKNCISDLEKIGSDKELLSILNNFVHPFNSFKKITFTYNDNNGYFSININKVYSDEDIEIINNKVDEIINSNITNDMNNYDKIKAIHDYIINTTSYDKLKTENIKDTTYRSNTAYGVLLEGEGICSGYSDAMSLFLNKFGIKNYRISNETHVWNLVFVNDKWLHLDLTWDDPIYEKNMNRDTYFLIDTKTLNALNDETHNFDEKIFSEAK